MSSHTAIRVMKQSDTLLTATGIAAGQSRSEEKDQLPAQ